MDPELAAYLDRRFGRIDEQFGRVDQRLDRIDEQVDQRFGRIDEHFGQVDRWLDETRRHFDVVAEGLREEIRTVAEGHLAVTRQLQEMRREQDVVHREILAAIKFSYAELDRRISRLEDVATDLQGRVARLEATR